MTNLDELEDLLRKDEKGKAYELIKEDRGITAEILMNEGINFGIIGEYNLSIAYFELAEKISEDEKIKGKTRKSLSAAYNNRGNAHFKLNQYEKAIADYNKAIELNPKYAKAYRNRGNAHFKLNQYEKAIADYNKAIELSPNLAEAYNNRGLAHHKLNQYEKAIADYNKAIELNPRDANAYYNRGNAYRGLNQYEEAIADYKKAIELDPRDANAYYNRGNAYRDLNQYEKAIADYNKAIELSPKDAVAYNNRGLAYYELNKHEEAIEDYNKAIELSPNLAQPYANRGITRLQTNEDLDKAVGDFKHARDLFEGKEKERTLGFIEWAKARKELNMKNWGDFRECINEAKEIFEKINDPLSLSFAASIKFSYLDEELDNALNIPDPIKALEEIETALKNLPEVEGLIDPEATIFGARVSSFAILSEFISSMRGIDENTDLKGVKDKLAELLEDSKKAEEAFESVEFIKGKTAIVDIQDVISSIREEIGKIEWAANKKQKALEILIEYWSRLGPAIKVMNGISTREIENITLGREIKELKAITSEGFEKSSAEHKEILEKIYETENILMQKDVANARYRIEIKVPVISSLSPISPKIIIDLPMGNLTEEQIEEKAKEIADKIKDLRGKVKGEFLEAIKRIPEIGDKLLERLKVRVPRGT